MAPLLLLSLANQGCDSGICMANSNVLEDSDADCIADDQDNCVLDGNPSGSYNPDQFDGNQNGVGQPCDVFDSVADTEERAVALIGQPGLNIAGEYEFADPACPGFGVMSVEQNENRVRAGDSTGWLFTGTAALDGDSGLITAELAGDGTNCLAHVDNAAATMEISCVAVATGEICRDVGQKTLTRLWTEGW